MNTIQSMQKVTEAASANGEAMKSIFELSLKAAQQMVALNGDFFRTFSRTDAMPANMFDLDAGMSAQAQRLERTAEYFRDLNELCLDTQVEIMRQSARRMSELVETAAEELGSAYRFEHIDGFDFTELMWTNLRSVGEAYERMFDSTREATETNLATTMTALQPAAGTIAARAATARAANSRRKAA